MAESEEKLIARWVETWRRAGPALEDIKRRELRSYDYQKNLPMLDGLLQWALDHATPRTSSGLVEQQRIFQKLRGEGGPNLKGPP